MSESNIELINSDLIEKAKAGDAKACGKIIELTQAKLFKFCILLGHNREFAEDLCQEVYIKALKNLNSLKEPKALQAWLYQIAKNLFIDSKRSQKELLNSEKSIDESLGNNFKEDHKKEDHQLFIDPNFEIILNVQQTLSQFEPEDRFILLLVEMEGLSYNEVALMVGKTESAIRSKLHRLRLEFIKKFK